MHFKKSALLLFPNVLKLLSNQNNCENGIIPHPHKIGMPHTSPHPPQTTTSTAQSKPNHNLTERHFLRSYFVDTDEFTVLGNVFSVKPITLSLGAVNEKLAKLIK